MTCTDELELQCHELNEAKCGARTDCFAYMGTRIDRTGSSREPVFIDCLDTTTCQGLAGYVVSGGACYSVGGMCSPDYPLCSLNTADGRCDPCKVFVNLPP